MGVEVTAEDFAYSPDGIEIDAGTELAMTNRGYSFHDLKVEGEPGVLIRRVAAGETGRAMVDLPPGSYTIYCTIDDHHEQGMDGTLLVR